MALSLIPFLAGAGLRPVSTFRSTEGEQKIRNAGGTPCAFALQNALEPDGFSTLDALFQDGGPDYLVDFAHGNLESLVATADVAAVGRYMQENVTCRAALVKWASRRMMAGRFGRMLYVSSTAAALQNGGQGFYAASKQASESLYRGAGIELAKKGITSAILRPGYVSAGRGTDYLETHGDRIRQRVPLGRAATPAEVAETLLFLLSDAARPINATVVTMDGGLTACK
ncbi:SDR family NAD(P)-dependent oxidoreductase [Desulfoluna butyratoxydans]|nr:SDR family oxidoreductase [Desulfoluna butyratoxydans]